MLMKIAAAMTVLFLVPIAVLTCTYADGPYTEVAPDLTVTVQFEGKPLAGASVDLYGGPDVLGRPDSKLKKATATDGTQFKDLKPGRYSVLINHLGIWASGTLYIEVVPRPTAGAKSKLEYRWGEKPMDIRQVAGRVTNSDPRANVLRQIQSFFGAEFPVVGANVELRHPSNGKSYKTKTDNRGAFALGGIPSGTYVLQLTGAPSSGGNFMVRLTPAAGKGSLHIGSTAGLCGAGYELRP
jgi:hypothetical protein